MKRLCMLLMLVLSMAMASHHAMAQEITIVLKPGCNWISYPNAEVMDIATALGDFTPAEGDAIKSQTKGAKYVNGRWKGSLKRFTPGLGYQYYSVRTATVRFVFNTGITVTTMDPTDITTTSAVCGGTVTMGSQGHVFARGLCWSTSHRPTYDDNHTSDGTDIGSFCHTLEDLSPNTTYYVRSYAVFDSGLIYGDQQSFTTNHIPSYTVTVFSSPVDGGTTTGDGIYEHGQSCTVSASANPGYVFTNWTENGEVVSTSASYTFTVNSSHNLVANFASNNGHSYVDLGLPSGLLWATCNIGASSSKDYGYYYAWGETFQKDYYSWTNYQYCMGVGDALTKYCSHISYGYNGFTDNLTTLLPEDDAATVRWGGNWRTPTRSEWQELYQNTTPTWTTQNGVKGILFTAMNGNTLFIPAAGYRDTSLEEAGYVGYYWSSSRYPTYSYCAWGFIFITEDWQLPFNYKMDFYTRYKGMPIRPVLSTN